MYRGNSRVIPVVLLLIFVVVAIFGLVVLGRLLLGGSAQPLKDDPTTKALLTTDADYSVRMTVRGPIVADEDFRSYSVTVSPTGREMTSSAGYDSRTVDNVALSNNTEAYTQFVGALNRASFSTGRTLSDTANNTDGACATGRLYTFEILEAQSTVSKLWTTSCSSGSGSFRGDASAVRTLFLRQIPTSNDMLRAINLPS